MNIRTLGIKIISQVSIINYYRSLKPLFDNNIHHSEKLELELNIIILTIPLWRCLSGSLRDRFNIIFQIVETSLQILAHHILYIQRHTSSLACRTLNNASVLLHI